MEFFSLTDIGLVRKKNQDSYITVYNENHDLLVLVCDGIGGHKAGEVASSEIVKYFGEVFSSHKCFRDDEDVITYLKYHVRVASNIVYKMSLENSEYEGMGTTITGILISSIGSYVVNAGDSRVYGYGNHELHQLTKDHTYVNELIDRCIITPEQAKTHPKRHYLTRFLGVYEDASCDAYKVSGFNEYYLVCSDGLHGYVPYEFIKKTIEDRNMSLISKTTTLLKKAISEGGYDNITLVLINMTGGNKHE